MEFLKRASSLPPLPLLTLKPFSGLLSTPTPHLLRPTPPSLGLSGPRGARKPGAPALSRGSGASTHPARHLRRHVRLAGCSSALSRARPHRARARLPPSRRRAANKRLSTRPAASPVPSSRRARASSAASRRGRGVGAILNRKELPGLLSAVTISRPRVRWRLSAGDFLLGSFFESHHSYPFALDLVARL